MVRESAYPYALPSHDFLASLEDCVQATEACCSSMQRGLEKLGPGTRDMPRLSKILRNKHARSPLATARPVVDVQHFLLLPQPTILAHKSAFSATVAPEIDALIARADRQLAEDKAKVARLEERLSILQSAQLPVDPPSQPLAGLDGMGDDDDDGSGPSKLDGLDLKELNPAQRRKVIMLRGKRERLEKEKERLTGAKAAQ